MYALLIAVLKRICKSHKKRFIKLPLNLIAPLMKRSDAVFAFARIRQVATRLLENHDGNKLRFYDHLNRIVKVRAFKLTAYRRARVEYGGGVKEATM